ncbi:helix-turn-helix domain-containing protein [Clostridium frigidicarnis]|uniref:Helix-turn-helix domain-containing protein n=1 Tax=Clostridium frigidicarnis TaxID=84698 RepID=A0A1I0V3W5_9CLOT|nr:helix-turn-helix domain-containing protein [Clostridium frigidicarnis]SFA70803.1 Helix-turn-helix domain-containing protein [Clostridium frigidicarnis]
MTIGDRIKQIASERNLTISSIALGSEVSVSYLNEIVNNVKKNPSVYIVKNIADYLQIPIENLLKN